MAQELDELFKLLQTQDAPAEGQPVTSPSQVAPQEVTKTVTPLPGAPVTPNPAAATPITEPRELEDVSRETTNLGSQDFEAEKAKLDDAEALKAEGIAGIAEAERAGAIDKAGLVDEYIGEMDQYEADAERKLAEADEDVRVLAGREPDPSRFWNNADTMTKVLYSVAALLQSVSKPDEVPMATKALNDMIERDIGMQEARMGRELDSAKGRAKTARELIQMSGDKAAVLYKEKQARIASLVAAAAARDMAKVQTADSMQESSKLRGTLHAAALKNRRDYEASLVRSAQLSAQSFRSSGGGGGGGSGGGGAAIAGPDGVKPDMLIPGLTGGYGIDGNGVKINKLTGGVTGTAFRELAQIGTSYQSGQGELANGLAIAYRVKEEGGGIGSLQKDSEWIAWLNAAKPTIAKAAGNVGMLTQRDVDAPVTGMGGAVISAEGFLSTLAEAGATPDKVIARIQGFSERQATDFKDGVVSRLDPEFIPRNEDGSPRISAVSAQGIYERRRAKAEAAKAAERAELIGGKYSKSGERLTGGTGTAGTGEDEAANVLPFVGGRDALSQEYKSVYSDARTPKERERAAGILEESAARIRAEIAKDPRNVGARIKLTRLEGMISELKGLSGKDTVKAKDQRTERRLDTEAELDSAKYEY